MKKFFLLSSIFTATMFFYGTAHAAIPAPYDLQAQWSVNGLGLHGQGVHFNYDSSFISQIKALRLYQKRPGASVFSEVATFNNVSSTYSECHAQTTNMDANQYGTAIGSWHLYHSCPEDSWEFTNSLLETASAFPAGQYDFYIAVLDASGGEVVVSPVASQYVLGQTKILSPALGDSPSDVTTLRWTVPSGWPRDFAYYVIEIFEGTPAGQGPIYMAGPTIGQANTVGEFSLSYPGPKLDSAKMYTILIQEGSFVIQKESPNPKNPAGSPYQSYISMALPVKIEAPPRALNIRVGQVTDTSVHVLWDSNVPAVSSMDYRTSLSGIGSTVTAWTSAFKTSHDTLLKNLTPNTIYYFSVRLKNALQNQLQDEFSEKNSFATLMPTPSPILPPPTPMPTLPPVQSSSPKPTPSPAPIVKPKTSPVPTLIPTPTSKSTPTLTPEPSASPQQAPMIKKDAQPAPRGFISRIFSTINNFFTLLLGR